MADPVSAFSGVAAILGLVPVLHSTKRLYVFFGELKDVSKNIRRLLAEVETMELFLEEAREYSKVLESSALAFEDKIHIPGVIRALNSCHLELTALHSCVKDADINDTEGKVKRMAKKMRFVSNHEEDISRPLRNIETSRKNLGTALLIFNGRCNISLQEQIRAARHDVSKLESASKTQFDALQAMVSDTSRRTQQLLTSDIQQTAKETQVKPQGSVLTASVVTDEKLSALANSIGIASLQTKEALQYIQNNTDQTMEYLRNGQNFIPSQMLARRGHKKASRKFHSPHSASRLKTHRPTKLADSAKTLAMINKKLEDIDTKFASITISSDPTRLKEATFEGFNLTGVTLPLMLVRPSLLMILQSLISGEQLKVSQSDVNLFSSQLGELLCECYEASWCNVFDSYKCLELLFHSGGDMKQPSPSFVPLFSVIWAFLLEPRSSFVSYVKVSQLVTTHGANLEDAFLHPHLLYVPSLICSKSEITGLMCQYLIQGGCNSENRNNRGETPLLFSASRFGTNNNLWIRALLENGCDRAAVDERGRSALHLSLLVCNQHRRVSSQTLKYIIWEKVTMLLRSGCDPYFEDSAGLTPSDYAAINGLWSIWRAAMLASVSEDNGARGLKRPGATLTATKMPDVDWCSAIWCYYCESITQHGLCTDVYCDLHVKSGDGCASMAAD
ncbi:hypothetical protein HYALB_00013440 [Hymenoscyphus albidus]|uniref:Fungal N-terminal domain-containing protein n=1 Tax=Hymenoscyphus albidus TaxID=595503 RepID=A0A9N9PYB3_9HELO|nr:hypothetical protein HYALB_00013440 [Hymenoscyphus albidus]